MRHQVHCNGTDAAETKISNRGSVADQGPELQSLRGLPDFRIG